jgi:hypothetical protein
MVGRAYVQVNTVERCSGHAGTWGVKKAPTTRTALKIGRPVFKSMANPGRAGLDRSDCQLAGHHISQGMQQAGTPARELAHPITLLRRAYGLEGVQHEHRHRFA